jgi:predicted MPP superfamily phosphohydrolase
MITFLVITALFILNITILVDGQQKQIQDSINIAIVTDTHIGESCNGDLSYDGCKPVRALTLAVEKINSMNNIDIVFVSGDITSSALYEEFLKADEILSKLDIPYYPILGNHDSWPYERHSDGSFNQTETPIGDEYFSKVFGSRLKEGANGKSYVSDWPTNTCLNGDYGYQTWHHNYVVRFPEVFPNLQILGLDWVSRGSALPEPGVGPEAELHDYKCGTTDWISKTIPKYHSNDTKYFIVQHHPFRNRDILDPFGHNAFYNFTFDEYQDHAVQNLLQDYFPPSSLLGIQAGHMHRWFDGTAFTKFTAINNEWLQVAEYETMYILKFE